MPTVTSRGLANYAVLPELWDGSTLMPIDRGKAMVAVAARGPTDRGRAKVLLSRAVSQRTAGPSDIVAAWPHRHSVTARMLASALSATLKADLITF